MSFPSLSSSLVSAAPFLLETSKAPRPHVYACTGIGLLLCLIIYTATKPKSPYNIDAIPAIGNTGIFSSYSSAWHYVKDAKTMLQEGYEKFRVFRIPKMDYWQVVISDEKLIEELRMVPDHVLSITEALREALAIDYTLGPNISSDTYHIPILRTRLTRNLGALFPHVRDEVVLSFDEILPVTDNWVKVKVLDTFMRVVSRVSNRVFVGAPMCRNPEYIALTIQVSLDVAQGSQIINLFPRFLKGIAARRLTNVPEAIRIGLKHLGPMIEERKQKINKFGIDYPGKPDDMLSWLMDEAKGEERSTRNITLRILALNFAAIHTSSNTFAHALYHLAVRPSYIEPIREEIEAVVAEEGWSKSSLSRMYRLDSFLKESQRVSGISGLSMERKVLEPYTFSDGTHVPKGSRISVLTTVRQCDKAMYPRGDEFDGFRFVCENGQVGRNQLATTSTDYLPFGHGRHACPGRFFAASELKTMMSHLLLTYDFKLENEGVRPADQFIGEWCLPNEHAEILFRRRQA